jgi:DNA-binding NtrC family response regulator
LRVVERVAQTSAAALISGESGTGKELLARAIHHYSLRCNNPWVDINCAALPEHLVESELFGYEKGAFTGADSPKLGLFELADKGTLFLDEIGELEAKTQVKLLRVLDGTPYYRVGGLRKISVEVRIVASTNRNLKEMVHAGKFRSDLYHRLSQIHLEVSPLRERPEDIVPLAEFFLQRQDARLRFSPDALDALKRYSWPGNVRELRNVVMKAAILAENLEIRASDLPAEIRHPSALAGQEPLYSLNTMERRMIFQVLAQTGGHHEAAAELLGISRRTLSRKLKRYGKLSQVESLAAC